ncbi:Trans-enoyl reductase [Lachnellula subtilissima]|uniref:Trans-enoyl reductase n=1 Tax=Lachnellula subtilissima TaxID=602034 RepID=A0A8H8RLZ8_9HELO|nr:Trans-enoyl reductase [Lachnellula subtilissima]
MGMSSLPSSQRGIVQDATGKLQLVDGIPLPKLLAGTVIVRVAAVALNPSDYKMHAAFPMPGAVVGNDFAGTIVAVAEGTTTDLKPGDLVCGAVNSYNREAPEDGAFAEFVRIPVEILCRMTEVDIPIEKAATLGTALATCSLALWATDALNIPSTPDTPSLQVEPIPVLVYGGSSASGTMAIQLLRLSGLDPIATCSPHNFELVRSYGASAVFDYTDTNTSVAIKAHTRGRLKYVLDCISDEQSVRCCYGAIARTGGRYTSLELVPDELLATRRAVQASFVMAFEVLGQEIKLPGGYGKPADPGKRELSIRCFAIYQRLLNEGKLRTHPTQLLEAGLESVLNGLALLKSGTISGKKLIVSL